MKRIRFNGTQTSYDKMADWVLEFKDGQYPMITATTYDELNLHDLVIWNTSNDKISVEYGDYVIRTNNRFESVSEDVLNLIEDKIPNFEPDITQIASPQVEEYEKILNFVKFALRTGNLDNDIKKRILTLFRTDPDFRHDIKEELGMYNKYTL